MVGFKTLKAFFTCKTCGKTRRATTKHSKKMGTTQRGGGCGCSGASGANGLFSGGGKRRRKSRKWGGKQNLHRVTGGGMGYLNPATFPDSQMPSGSYYPYDTALGGTEDPLTPANITDTRLVPEFAKTPDIMSGGSYSMLAGVPQSVNTYNAGTSATIFEKTVGGRRRRNKTRRNTTKKTRRNKKCNMRGGVSSLFNQQAQMNPYSSVSSAIHGGEHNMPFGQQSAFGSLYGAGHPPQVA
jgi:hypothetical protein